MPTHPLGNFAARPRGPQSFSVAESEWLGASVETARIVNVNINDWSVDVVSEYGNKRWFDLQVMAPYLHYMNGEGIYVQPEVGSLCWVCVPSGGRFAAPFVMGFKTEFDEGEANFRAGRQALNPGDIMLRTRDENFVVLRRGGVVQIGATPTAQRFYIPIRNFIRDFCENYELFSFGGELTWITDRDDKTTDGSAPTKFTLKSKEKADNEGHIASLSIGSHGEGSPTTLLLEISESGDKGAAVVAHMDITKEGSVNWKIKKSWELIVDDNDFTVKTTAGSIFMDAGSKATMQAQQDVLVKSASSSATVDGMSLAKLKSATMAVVDAPFMYLGDGASSPVVKGDMLVTFLANLLTQISMFTFIAPLVPAPGPPVPVIAAPAVASLMGQLPSLLSTNSFTK